MENHDSDKKSKYITYLDANNLIYDYVMSQSLNLYQQVVSNG